MNPFKSNLSELTRRTLLKSAAVLAGSAAMASTIPVTAANMSTQSNLTSKAQSGSPPISKPMVGFMLAHEQFPVPELVNLGVAAEQAGFDLLATSVIFNPGKQTNDTPAKLG